MVGRCTENAAPHLLGTTPPQAEEGGGRQDTVAVLREMLSEASSPEAQATLQAELEAVRKGVDRQRKK